MDRTTLRNTVIGFLVAVLLLGGLFWIVGIDELLSVLSRTRPKYMVAVGVAALAWLGAWGLALRTVLDALDTTVSRREAIGLFTAAQFLNNVTPFGQAGGEPFIALLLSRRTTRDYRTGLAAIATVDVINFAPPLLFVVVALIYYATLYSIGRPLRIAGLIILGLGIVGTTVGYILWTRHERVIDIITRIVSPFLAILEAYIPYVTVPSGDEFRTGVREFYKTVDRIAGQRYHLTWALVFATAGWLCRAVGLWIALYAFGVTAPFPALLVAIPVGALASVTPLPGGLGGFETLLAVYLVAMTPATPVIAGAAIILHRGATYWLPVILGGGIAAVVTLDR